LKGRKKLRLHSRNYFVQITDVGSRHEDCSHVSRPCNVLDGNLAIWLSDYRVKKTRTGKERKKEGGSAVHGPQARYGLSRSEQVRSGQMTQIRSQQVRSGQIWQRSDFDICQGPDITDYFRPKKRKRRREATGELSVLGNV